jgi:hypothetical protein
VFAPNAIAPLRSPCRRGLALLLLTLLAACQETGDFGRPLETTWTSSIMPSIGHHTARMRGEPASTFALTDDESELRARAFRFLMPAQDTDILSTQLKHFAQKRLIPASLGSFDERSYFASLQSQPDRSPRARYQRLREDIEADRQLMGPFVALACRVAEADRVRLKALAHMRQQNGDTIANAKDRVAENETLVQWVYTAIEERARSYRFALENLVVETPDRDAVRVERQLIGFDGDRAALMRCGAVSAAALPATPSGPRFTPRPEKPPLPPK